MAKTSAKATETIEVNLRRTAFTSLLMREFTEPWTQLGLKDFEGRDLETMTKLIGFLPEIELFDPDFLVLTKSDKGGSIEKTFRIGVYRDGNELVLLLGSNGFPMQQNGGLLTCGQLKGMIATETIDADKKTFATTCNLRSPSVDGVIYSFEVGVWLDNKDGSVKKSDIDGVIIDGNDLVDYLEQKPTRPDKLISLVMTEDGEIVDLPLEFAVKTVTLQAAGTESQYGDSFIIHLRNGKSVYASGNSDRLARSLHDNGEALPGSDSNPWKLVISSCYKQGEGKDSKFVVQNRLSPGSAAELPSEGSSGNASELPIEEALAVAQ